MSVNTNQKSLKDIVLECALKARIAPWQTVLNKGKVHKWYGHITKFVKGKLKVACFSKDIPNFGLVFVDGTEEIPCIIANAYQNIRYILSIIGRDVLLVDPYFIVELYKGSYEKENMDIRLFLKWKDVREKDKSVDLSGTNYLPDTGDKWYRSIIVLDISSAILSTKEMVLCFVLVKDRDNGNLLWLILKNHQVAWKDFILANYLYTLEFPNSITFQDAFQKNVKPLWEILREHDNGSKFLSHMSHHNDLIKWCQNGTFLPEEGKIFLSGFIEDIPSSLGDETNFPAVEGIVTNVFNNEEDCIKNGGACSLCSKIVTKEAPAREMRPENFVGNRIEIPGAVFNIPSCLGVGFGMIRGLYFTIKLKNEGGREFCVYMKNCKQVQYPVGLIAGARVRITNVKAIKSQKGNLYYLNTPLTRIFHLDLLDHTAFAPKTSDWSVYGFPGPMPEGKNKFWGPLELELLTGASIKVKCIMCGDFFQDNECASDICRQSDLFQPVATAGLFIRGPDGRENSVFLKDDHVRKYLDIPIGIWNSFKNLAKYQPFVYKRKEEPPQHSTAHVIFSSYCQFLRPRKRMHILCKRFESNSTELQNETKYFCIGLREIDEDVLKEIKYGS